MRAGRRGPWYHPNAGVPGTVRGLGALSSPRLACAAWVLVRESTEPPLSSEASSAALTTVCTEKHNMLSRLWIQLLGTIAMRTFTTQFQNDLHTFIWEEKMYIYWQSE